MKSLSQTTTATPDVGRIIACEADRAIVQELGWAAIHGQTSVDAIRDGREAFAADQARRAAHAAHQAAELAAVKAGE